jgi:hypothetical protein
MDYNKITTDMIKQSIHLLEPDGWTKFAEKNGFVIDEKIIAGSNVSGLKTCCHVDLGNKTIMDIVDLIYNPTKEMYNELVLNEVIEDISNNIHIAHSEFYVSSLVSNREFLILRFYEKLDNGCYFVCTKSIKRDNYPLPRNNANVEGNAFRCVILKPLPDNKIDLTSLDHIEPNGWIPDTIVNSFKSSANNWIIKMQEIINNK